MPKKLTYQEVYDFIKNKGYELLSKEYISSKKQLEIKCRVCQKNYKQTLTNFTKGYYHPYCENEEKKRFGGYKTPIKLLQIQCPICKIIFKPKRSVTKLCSQECSNILWRTQEYKEKAKNNGSIGGKLSVTKQKRRSKNEIYFSELCEKYFKITTNEPFFDGWDADIIIHSEKIAILWNGAWHYKQISKKQSLQQVQTRDKIKTNIIKKYGYVPYIIKDMGKYNKKFVEQEFEMFILMIKGLKDS